MTGKRLRTALSESMDNSSKKSSRSNSFVNTLSTAQNITTNMSAKRLRTTLSDMPESLDNISKKSSRSNLYVKTLSTTQNRTTLSDMPESLQIRILASLDARHAIQTCVLSKSWLSSWTCIPVLNFCSDGFTKPQDFDNFVLNALSRRQPLKLDKLTFKRDGVCSVKILEKVFDYASSHGVEELEAKISVTRNEESWPNASSDSLTSLKLESQNFPGFLFLKPRSGSFKNLTNLHLKWVTITDLDLFSGFPALQKLKLVYLFLRTDGWALNVHAPQLEEFTIMYFTNRVNHCELITPKLTYLEWHGTNIPQLKAHLPVLDTVIIKYNGGYIRERKHKTMFGDLLNLFNTLNRAKSLTLSSRIVELLTLYPNELVRSAFQDLKCLKLDFTCLSAVQPVLEGARRLLMKLLPLAPRVKAYLLHKSHNAKCTIMVKPDLKAQALTFPYLRDNKHSAQLEF